MKHASKNLVRAIAVGGLLVLALAIVLGGQAPAPADAQGQLVAYKMVDQWPERRQATTGLFQNPIDMDVATDGRVYIADAGINGVHTLLATGVFAAPFGVTGGYPAQLGRVGRLAVGPVPGGTGERVYVLDMATNRIVIYDQDGGYIAAWDGIDAAAIAASTDGRVYILDRETSQVRALDAATGAERFAFGERGTERGQFANFSDVDISPDGRVLVVADLNAIRVQLFDMPDDATLAGVNPPAPAKFRRIYELLNARFNKGDNGCRSSRVNALGEDKVFVGEGTTACLIDNTDVTFAIATSASSGTICRATVRQPVLKAEATQYFAIATHDPNTGACGSKRTELATSLVVVRYSDEELRTVRAMWQAEANDALRDPALFAPQKLSMPAEDVVFVEDMSSKLRFYGLDGTSLGTVARDSSVTDAGTDTEFFRLAGATGAETLGEVYAAYIRVRRSGTTGEFETGIGRFKNEVKNGPSGPVDVIGTVWKYSFASMGSTGRRAFTMPFLAFNAASGEVLTMMSESVDQQRTVDMKMLRFTTSGTRLSEAWDLPDDGRINPYVDMTIGPDGRIYLLDDLADVVRILTPDGQPAGDVPVAVDARAVAGGPASLQGSVFVLREAGAIERYADDGTITARLDGRPLAFSDATTLTDLVVDNRGRVYVADGQSSLISVFEQTDDPDVLPVPDDGTCLYRAEKSADPTQLKLGESVTLTLGVEGLCAAREDPSDIVVVIPYYGELQQGRDPATMLITQLMLLGSRLDYSIHRMGIVSYYQTTNVELPLTHDRAAFGAAVLEVKRYTAPNTDVKARLKNGMETAAKLFDAESAGRRKVMLLLNPIYCDPANERTPGQCAGYVSASDSAAEIRAAGVTIVVLAGFGGGGQAMRESSGDTGNDQRPPNPGDPGGPGTPGQPPRDAGGGSAAANLASSDEDVLRGPLEAYRRMVNYHIPDSLMTDLTIVDTVPDTMAVDVPSIGGGGSWTAPEATWARTAVDYDGAEVAFRITPLQPGRQHTNVSAVAEVVDGWGVTHTLTFPLPVVDVIGPTPTAVPPSATPTATTPAASPTPTLVPPTATPAVQAIYLPWLSRNQCIPGTKRLDLAIAIDTSSSMSGDKLAAAEAAAGALLDAMNLGPAADHAAVLAFGNEPRLLHGPSGDRAALSAAMTDLAITPGTRIDRALAAALDVLAGTDGRPGAAQVVVLLSDGGQTEAPDTARAAGQLARDRGVTVYTIGLGDDVDAALLASVAGDAGHYTFAAAPADLQGVYARIAAGLDRCP